MQSLGSSSDSEDDSSLSDDAEEPSSVTPVPVAPKPSKKPSLDEVALETAMDMATSREEEELGKVGRFVVIFLVYRAPI